MGLLLVATIPALAQTTVEGTATAASFRIDNTAPMQADAYLLGFRQNGADESAYEWSFEADEVTIALTTKHYVGYQETRNDTQVTTHHDASGVLLERHQLAYLMATSSRPDDARATFNLSLSLPPQTLEPRSDIDYDSVTEGGSPIPVFGDVFNGNPGSTHPVASYQQPWSNLARALTDFHGAITLGGNFILDLYDAVFQIQDRATTTYNATYGGWRGIEPDGANQAPPAEWDVRYARLSLTNATFTFYPAGRPVELALHSAGLDVSGGLILRDVQGRLQDDAGIQRGLNGALVELGTKQLRLNAQAAPDPEDPGVQVAFAGSVNSATVDGRALALSPDAQTVADEAMLAANVPDARSNGLAGNWLLVLAGVAVVGAATWWLRRQYQARANPEFLMGQSHISFEMGRMTRARALVMRVLRHHPNNADALAHRAIIHLHHNQFHEALTFLKPHLDGPADGDGLLSFIYCVALRKAKGEEEAGRFLQKALRKHPDLVHLTHQYPDMQVDNLLGETPAYDASPSYN